MAISQWPSFVVTPDGVVASQAEHENPDILFTDVDTIAPACGLVD